MQYKSHFSLRALKNWQPALSPSYQSHKNAGENTEKERLERNTRRDHCKDDKRRDIINSRYLMIWRDPDHALFESYQAASQFYVDAAYCYRGSSVVSVALSRSWAPQKRLNRWRCRLVVASGGPRESCIRWGPYRTCEVANLRGGRAAHCKVRIGTFCRELCKNGWTDWNAV